MNAARWTIGLAVLLTVIVVLSTLGLTAASSSSRVPTSSPASETPAKTASVPPSAIQPVLPSPNARPSAKAPPTVLTNPTAVPTPSDRMSAALAELHTLHVPLKYAFLPNLNANPDPTLHDGIINFGYSSAPAPLGVAEYGLRNISGTITPYTLSTSSVEGTFAPGLFSGLSMDISGPDEYGVQLNSVLNNVTLFGSTGYQFWTQNVIEYSTYSHQIFFVSNIWNFSSSLTPLDTVTPNIFYQIGPNATVASPEYYYGLGGPITISYPFTLNLFLNSTLIDGRDAVFFNFTLSNSTVFYAGSYDHAIFNSTVTGGPVTPVPAYVASGNTYTHLGLPGDFEMVTGGPGGGSNFDILSADAYFGLQYWDSTTGSYQVVPSAYGFGSETGETAVGGYDLFGTGYTGLGGSPNVFMAAGPAVLQGLWNVSSATPPVGVYGGAIDVDLNPTNAFLFVAPGSVFNGWTGTNWALFEWAPSPDLYLDAGTYTIIAILANYDPVETTATVATSGLVALTLTLTADLAQGVYTPLWAVNNPDVANISTYAGGTYFLANDQYGPIGYAPATGTNFPWFGQANDYLFPVYPGILLWNTSVTVDVNAPSSFEASYPASILAELENAGFPTTNDLQMLFYDVSSVTLSNGAQIGGWWYSGAYFGPSVSAYNVVFWNATGCRVFGNTFATGGNALYLYGGTENLIYNNTFESSLPVSANSFASVAGTYGSMGLFEADYGNATAVATQIGIANLTYPCFNRLYSGYCDVIFNNLFLTPYTADSPEFDPYYFYLAYPTCPAYLGLGPTHCLFDDSWNLVPGTSVYGEVWSTNILGGPNLGGNFWWNYGSSDDPYNQIPYVAFDFGAAGITGISFGGDYLPLSLVPLYQVSFVETGLPAGTEWYVGTLLPNGAFETGYTDTDTSSLTLPAGYYTYYPVAISPYWASVSGSFSLTGNELVIDVTFSSAFVIAFEETGLPTDTEWTVYLYNSAFQYVGSGGTSGTTVNETGLLPGVYYWEAYTNSAAFVANPEVGEVTVSGNTTVTITYAPLHFVTVNALGLPANTDWTLIISNATYADSFTTAGSTLTLYGPGDLGTYNWSAVSAGYVTTPGSGTFSLAVNSTINVTFAAHASITFTETGLASGAGWTVAFTQDDVTRNITGTGASIVIPAGAGPYSYTVSAPGYTTSGSYGSGTLPQSAPVQVVFSAIAPASGTLSVTVVTGGAVLTVNGVVETAPFSQPVAPGVYAIVVSESGYVTYYNNVTVNSGATSSVTVKLTPASSSSSSSGISSEAWVLVGVLAALALVLLGTTLLAMRRGRSPPPPRTAYSPPAGAGMSGGPAGTPPAATPPWSEGQTPPPASGPK